MSITIYIIVSGFLVAVSVLVTPVSVSDTSMLSPLTQSLMAQYLDFQETVRSDGSSGIKQVRSINRSGQ